MTTRLYHYTCDDGRAAILREGVVKPFPQTPLGGLPLAWFTDLDAPIREALGLTSHSLSCDRTAHRFEATEVGGLRWWPQAVRDRGLHQYRRGLELATGAAPMHWYVSLAPVPVRRADRAAREAAV